MISQGLPINVFREDVSEVGLSHFLTAASVSKIT